MNVFYLIYFAIFGLIFQSNPVQVYRGFISNLPMEPKLKETLTKMGVDCLYNSQDAIWDLAKSLHKDIQEKNFIQALKDIILADDLIEHKIAPQCIQTYQMIFQFFSERSGQHPFPYSNGVFSLFRAGQIQILARIIQDLTVGNNPYGAGEKIATYFAVDHRLVPVEVPYFEDWSYEKYVPLDRERYLNEFWSSFLKELGANQFQVNTTIACLKDVVHAFNVSLSNPNLHRGDRLTAMTAFLEGAMMVNDSFNRCSKTVDFSGVATIAELFKRYPAQFIFKVISNVALEYLSMETRSMEVSVHREHGEYIEAGRSQAKMVKIALKDIAF